VGRNWDYSTITNCYSTGDVNGAGDYVGGLVGQNGYYDEYYQKYYPGDIYKCYSVGDVVGDSNVGGLVGGNIAGEIGASFWDVNTSGRSTSAGGIGKTTAEMKTKSTFTDAGWDFVDIWYIIQAVDYPRLRWQTRYSGGSGTADDPYRIETAKDLNDIGNHQEDLDKHFILINDVNLAEYSGTQFNRIGTDWNSAFTGVFNGNSHKIWNFTWDSNGINYYIGLFGYVIGGQIKDLGMENVDVNTVDGVGVGGLVGVNDYGTITNCYSTGSVSGYSCVGGLVGDIYYGTIRTCYSAGSVSGKRFFESYVGGLVGFNAGGDISNCYSTSSVSGSNVGSDIVGGLVGYSDNEGTITNCYSTGSVDGNDCVGGLVAYNNGMITNCYSIGNVSGTGGWSSVGGLVAGNYGTIANCYSTGNVSGPHIVGGLVGYNVFDGKVLTSFWDVNTSGQTSSAGGTPKTTAEMKAKSTFTDAGWDFVCETINGLNDVWTIKEGVDYPKLVWPLVNLIGWYEVDFADFAAMANWWGRTDCADANDCEGADFDFTGEIDFSDLKIFCNYWLEGL